MRRAGAQVRDDSALLASRTLCTIRRRRCTAVLPEVQLPDLDGAMPRGLGPLPAEPQQPCPSACSAEGESDGNEHRRGCGRGRCDLECRHRIRRHTHVCECTDARISIGGAGGTAGPTGDDGEGICVREVEAPHQDRACLSQQASGNDRVLALLLWSERAQKRQPAEGDGESSCTDRRCRTALPAKCDSRRQLRTDAIRTGARSSGGRDEHSRKSRGHPEGEGALAASGTHGPEGADACRLIAPTRNSPSQALVVRTATVEVGPRNECQRVTGKQVDPLHAQCARLSQRASPVAQCTRTLQGEHAQYSLP
mmetsp:Transcript_144696/g.463651  ORF Transcript_144696/g.463651 Transcript_144696/m.463651 type:complete len:310 (-) Transcript_144696:2335-3264(-)